MHKKNTLTWTTALAMGAAIISSPAMAFWDSNDIAAEKEQWRAAVESLDTHGLDAAPYLVAFDHIEKFNAKEAAPFMYALSADLRYGVSRDGLSAEQKEVLNGYVQTLLEKCEQPTSCLQKISARHEQYAPLQAKLKEYKAYTANNLWPSIAAGKTIKDGMRDARVVDIRSLLRLTGDLPADVVVANPTDTLYDEVTQAAVRSFQARHGLEVDGSVGPATLAAMQISPNARAEQIALTLERLRKADDAQEGKHVLVNVPSYTLKAMDGAEVKLRMDVIVGKTARATPLFNNSINRVVINPTWTPTYKILSKDLMPKFRNNPAYAVNGGYKIYDRAGGYQVDPMNVDWESTSASDLRVVQSAGTKNALGKVKFLLPDNDSVYLHDTSHRELFVKAERALSSGCVRLSDPKAMMEYVLAAQGGDVLENAQKAWDGTSQSHINLSTPIPVNVTYYTAAVNAEGKVEFYNDVYKKNDALELAMSKHNPQYAMREYRLAMEDMQLAKQELAMNQ